MASVPAVPINASIALQVVQNETLPILALISRHDEDCPGYAYACGLISDYPFPIMLAYTMLALGEIQSASDQL